MMFKTKMIKVASLVSLLCLAASNAFAITAGGTATASRDWSSCSPGDNNYVAAKAFDRNESTSWHTGCYKVYNINPYSGVTEIYVNPFKTGWLQYDFGANKTITGYAIQPSNLHNLAYAPKSWTFEAWNGTSWVVLDTRTNVTGWTYNAYQNFSFANTKSYRMYRLNVSANSGAQYLAIAELVMIQTIYN